MIEKSYNNYLKIPEISEQKENILTLNADLVYGVYEKIKISDENIILRNTDNILTAFPDKFSQLQWLENNPDIIILDAQALRKWKIHALTPHNLDNKNIPSNLTLLSSGIIEVIESNYIDTEKTIHKRQHFPTTLRDSQWLGAWLRNSVAGRNSTTDLHGDIMREYSEESPYLIFKNWKFYLSIPFQENTQQATHLLRDSVNFFLEHKYLTKDDENFSFAKNIFEKSFRHKIQYENLGEILKKILKNNDFDFYSSKEITNYDSFPWIEAKIREIQMIDASGKIISKGKFFVNENTDGNTLEYMQLRSIRLPDGIIAPTGRLYLESQNQGSKNERIQTLGQNTLPVLKNFANTINHCLNYQLCFWEEEIYDRSHKILDDFERKNIRVQKLKNHEKNFQEINTNSLNIIQKEAENIVFHTNFNNFHRLLNLIENFQKNYKILENNPEKAMKIAYSQIDQEKNLEKWTNCSGMAHELQIKLQAKWIHSYVIRFSAFGYLDNEYVADGHAGLIIPATINGKRKFIFVDPGIRITQPIIFDENHSTEVECDNKKFSIQKNTDNNQEFDYYLKGSSKEGHSSLLPFRSDEKWLNPQETIIPNSVRSRGVYKIQKFNPNNDENVVFLFDMAKESFGLQIEKTMEYISFDEFIKIFESNLHYENREKFLKIFEKFWENPEEIIPQILDTLKYLKLFQKIILTKNSQKVLAEKQYNAKIWKNH